MMENSKAVVFLIDDDPAILKALPRALRRYSLEVRAFSSATEFLQAYEGTPGCLLLDLSMPDMTGLELQQELNSRNVNLPVIFITGHGAIRHSVQALKAGAVDFLEKPFLPEALLEKIDEAFGNERRSRAEFDRIKEIRSRFSRLTERECDVLKLLQNSEGIPSSKHMARALEISHRTVEHHRSKILEKTATRSVAELLAMAKKAGLVLKDTEQVTNQEIPRQKSA